MRLLFWLALVLLLAPQLAVAQDDDSPVERVWERSQLQQNAPDWFGASDDSYTERGLAYGVVDDGAGAQVERVFVVQNGLDGSALAIRVLDAATGDDAGTLSVTGIPTSSTERHLALNDIEVAEDGTVYACNAPNNTFIAGDALPFRCWSWTSLTDTPTLVIENTDIAASDEWMGEQIAVTGPTDTEGVRLYSAAQRTSKRVYRFASSDGASFTLTPIDRTGETGLNVSAATGNIGSVAPLGPGDAGFYFSYGGDPPLLYDAAGAFQGSVPSSIEVAGSGDVRYFERGDEKVLVAYRYGPNQQQASLLRVTDGPAAAGNYGLTPTMGIFQNIQGNGDLDVRLNDDDTATIYVLSTNNGIGAYKTVDDLVVIDTEDPAGDALGLELAAFPNPTRGDAMVRWQTAAGGAVRLAVYDALGRRVAILAETVAAPGQGGTVQLDREMVGAGVYLIRLEAATGARVARLAVTR